MVAQEPVKAAIWHSLNTYCYHDAIFLAERLYAEVPNEEVLHLLGTCYHRAGQSKRAYTLLKKNTHTSVHNKFLYATLCSALEKYSEVEVALLGTICSTASKSVTTIVAEFGSLAGVALQLLGNVFRKTQQIAKAAEHFKQSLKCNPFLWKSFESLLQIGEKVDPQDFFKTSGSFKDPTEGAYAYSFTNPMTPIPHLSHLDSLQISSENLDPSKPLMTSTVIKSHDLSSSRNSSDVEMPPPAGKTTNAKVCQRLPGSDGSDGSLTPSFGVLPVDSPVPYHHVERSSLFITPPVGGGNTVSNVKAPVKNPVKKANIKMTSKTTRSYGLSGLSLITPSSGNRCSPSNDNENISMTGLRRSSRLFGSSPREMKRIQKVHFADSKIDTNLRKTKANNRSTSQPLTPTTKNIQTTAAMPQDPQDLLVKDVKPITSLSPIQQSADGLMSLLQDIGKSCTALYLYDSKRAAEMLEALPMHQLNTCWVMEKLAIAYFEMNEMKMAQKAFEKVRELDPYYIDEGMAIFSTLLWLSRKESLLSSLAQDLVDCEKMSAPSWCAMANCFSLQKEHDLAIKFLKRAIQLQPDFVYAYTLLGHEYVFTEELDLALSCFRSALRYNERHYNAWYGIGMVYYKQEKFNLAEQHYKLAIKIHPKSSVLLCHLAVTQHELGKPEQALETIHKAIELNPKNGLCKYHKARFLMSLDKVREALEELEQLKRIVPKDYLVYFLIGKAHQQLDEPHLAQMNFSWAMSLDPQGTNTTIKEAMNQQHYMSADHDFLDDITEDNAPDSLPGLSVEDDTMSD